MLGNDFFEEFEKQAGKKFTDAQKERIREHLGKIIDYVPKVGVFGKTGVGKSSLCNALFGQDVCPVNDIQACTRDPQEVFLNLGGKGLKLLDLPGVGETQDRNNEYANLYNRLLPELDVVLWVLKGDDRAYAEDEWFYKNIVKPHIEQVKSPLVFFFVLNQVDKIEPYREWDVDNRKPGVNQLSNIDKKLTVVADVLQFPKVKVIPVSANENYNLETLVETVVYDLPKEKRVGLVRELKQETISEKTQKTVEKGFWESVKETISDVAEFAKEVVVEIVERAIEKAGRVLKDLLPWWYPGK